VSRASICALVVFVFFSAPAFAGERLVYKSGRAQNVFVELYTSDANPDCNEALRWMSSLNEGQYKSDLWWRFIPIAMHVHYWDVPGYRDTFARPTFDNFLLQYKRKWNSRYVFAPTVVVNGTEWGGWSRGQGIPETLPKETGILKADGSKREGHYWVEFFPERTLTAEKWTVHAALLAFNLKSKPSEGDNRGKILAHDFVALSYRESPLKLYYGTFSADIELAPTKGVRIEQYAVVFWVTETGDLLPVQATGGYWYL